MRKTKERFWEKGANECELYERLRSGVIESRVGFRGAYGLGLIIIQGMAAWREAVLENPPPEIGEERSSVHAAPRVLVDGDRNLISLLADVIIKQCQLEI